MDCAFALETAKRTTADKVRQCLTSLKLNILSPRMSDTSVRLMSETSRSICDRAGFGEPFFSGARDVAPGVLVNGLRDSTESSLYYMSPPVVVATRFKF